MMMIAKLVVIASAITYGWDAAAQGMVVNRAANLNSQLPLQHMVSRNSLNSQWLLYKMAGRGWMKGG